MGVGAGFEAPVVHAGLYGCSVEVDRGGVPGVGKVEGYVQ